MRTSGQLSEKDISAIKEAAKIFSLSVISINCRDNHPADFLGEYEEVLIFSCSEGHVVHINKTAETVENSDDLEFKSSELPDSIDTGLLDCEVKKCYTVAEYAATTNQTNCIWYLCNEHNQRMSEGEVWW